MIKSVTIKSEQSLFDVVLQYYGSASRVYDFLALNPQIPNVLYNNLKGMTVRYEEQINTVAVRFRKNGNVLATKFPQSIGSPFAQSFYLAITPEFQLALENSPLQAQYS